MDYSPLAEPRMTGEKEWRACHTKSWPPTPTKSQSEVSKDDDHNRTEDHPMPKKMHNPKYTPSVNLHQKLGKNNQLSVCTGHAQRNLKLPSLPKFS